jgi:hypothetical protein
LINLAKPPRLVASTCANKENVEPVNRVAQGAVTKIEDKA